MAMVRATEAREHFSEFLNRAAYGKERVILTRHGKALAAIVPLEDINVLRLLEVKIDVEDATQAKKR